MPLPDPEVMMVNWAKADPVLAPMLGAPDPVRVATRIPIDPVLPFLRVVRTGGTRERSEAPIENPTIQWDAVATKPGGSPDFTLASLIIRSLVERLDLINYQQVVISGGLVYGVEFINGPFRVEGPPDTEWARYLLETEIWTREI